MVCRSYAANPTLGRREIDADDLGKGFVLDDLVTLASSFFEARSVKDNNLAASIPDEPGLLKRSGDKSDGCSAYSEHLGQELLGQRKRVRIDSILHLQQPSGKPRFCAVNGIACGNVFKHLRRQHADPALPDS